MGDIRELTNKDDKWYLSKEARITAIHYARQYGEWKTEHDTTTEGERKEYLEKKMKLIEDTVKETDKEGGLYNWLLACVTTKTSYAYLSQTLGMPCGEEKYHKMKREFFYRLSKKI